MKDGLFTRKERTASQKESNDPDGDRIIGRLRQRGLKVTKQRKSLARIFQQMDHVTVEELHERAVREDPDVGRITVYRFLKLLCQVGLARERHFDDSISRFDNVVTKEHHDHLICEQCGKIVEFTCDKIEHLQEEISGSRGFLILSHRLEIRGVCRECRRAG